MPAAEAPADPWTEAMREGDFARAWAVNDAVLAARDPRTRDDPTLPYHRRWVWDGTPPDGRDVLVRCYHGIGDTLMFARFLPALAARARTVRVEAPAVLLPVLARLAPGVEGLAFDVRRPGAPAECSLEIMELGHVLRPDARELGRVSSLGLERQPPDDGTIHVGLCWACGDWAPERAVPLTALVATCSGPGIVLHSLQRGVAAEEARAFGLAGTDERSMDVLATARAIAALHAVVTIDTMVAHLAALVGTPTTVVLPENADWRWMRGERSAWYPGVRLVREWARGREAGGASRPPWTPAFV